MTTTKKIASTTTSIMVGTAKFLFKGAVLNKKTGADFAKPSSYSDYLNTRNTGLLIDGDNLRLSKDESYQNVCVMARVGAGKTSRYVIPNVLDKARQNCSMVINDPKGEVFENTSEHLKQNGYRIIVIDPENLERSSRFNPLMEAKTDIELEQVAEILVRCGSSTASGKDDFWLQGAIRFMSLFIKCLKNAGEENTNWFNLHNLYHLFQNFGQDGTNLDEFMIKYTQYLDSPEDETLWNEWKGVQVGNKDGVLSFVMNAITSLKSLSNRSVATLTAISDFNLENIRHEKTAIFVITPAQHAEYYSFLVSLFFRSVFNACMREMPNKKTLPVYVLYDEFGHSTIPNFVSTANTIRGYKVSLSIILQSISQLDAKYGKDTASSIQGGFNSYLTYSGADPQTASFFERIIGKVKERQKVHLTDTTDRLTEYNLMNANEIRTIKDNEAVFVSKNRQPVLLKTSGYYQIWGFKRQAGKGACRMPKRDGSEALETVKLRE